MISPKLNEEPSRIYCSKLRVKLLQDFPCNVDIKQCVKTLNWLSNFFILNAAVDKVAIVFAIQHGGEGVLIHFDSKLACKNVGSVDPSYLKILFSFHKQSVFELFSLLCTHWYLGGPDSYKTISSPTFK